MLHQFHGMFSQLIKHLLCDVRHLSSLVSRSPFQPLQSLYDLKKERKEEIQFINRTVKLAIPYMAQQWKDLPRSYLLMKNIKDDLFIHLNAVTN